MTDETTLLNLISDIQSEETESEEIKDKIADLEAEVANCESDLASLAASLRAKRIQLEDLIDDLTAAKRDETF